MQRFHGILHPGVEQAYPGCAQSRPYGIPNDLAGEIVNQPITVQVLLQETVQQQFIEGGDELGLGERTGRPEHGIVSASADYRSQLYETPSGEREPAQPVQYHLPDGFRYFRPLVTRRRIRPEHGSDRLHDVEGISAGAPVYLAGQRNHPRRILPREIGDQGTSLRGSEGRDPYEASRARREEGAFRGHQGRVP